MSIRKIVQADDFVAVRKLYNPPSRILNWYMAEQVDYYSLKMKIPEDIVSDAKKINGLKGFPKFRSINVLESIYGSK